MNHDTCFLNNFQHQKQWIRCMCQVSKTFLIPCHVLFRRWKHPQTHRKPLSRLDELLQPRIGRLCKERLVDRRICRKKILENRFQKTMDSQFQSRTRFDMEIVYQTTELQLSCQLQQNPLSISKHLTIKQQALPSLLQVVFLVCPSGNTTFTSSFCWPTRANNPSVMSTLCLSQKGPHLFPGR